MFLHKVQVERITAGGEAHAVPIAQLDNFCMRNFTNDAVFDDTLPIHEGRLEVGSLVPLDRMQSAMEQWFRRKGFLLPDEALRITPLQAATGA